MAVIPIADKKISGGLYEVMLSRSHVYRKVRSCKILAAKLRPDSKQFRLARKTAELSLDDPIGIYCVWCEEMITVGAKCYKRRVGKGRSTYYHVGCAEIVHLI